MRIVAMMQGETLRKRKMTTRRFRPIAEFVPSLRGHPKKEVMEIHTWKTFNIASNVLKLLWTLIKSRSLSSAVL